MTLNGAIWQTNAAELLYKTPMINTVRRLCLIAENAAKKELMDKAKNPSGTLFGTFYFDMPIKQQYEVRGMVFAGGPIAPYAPIVDYIGWKLKSGKKEPYYFMRKGAEVARKEAPKVLKEEFNKIK